MEYYKIFSSPVEYNAYMEDNDVVLPNISLIISGHDVRITPWDFESKYLTFKIKSDGVIKWKGSYSSYTLTISYSKDNGTTWTDITSDVGNNAPSISVTSGETVLFKGNNITYCPSNIYQNNFNGTTCQFSVEGNIMSLIYGDDFIDQTILPQNTGNTFYGLFCDCTGMTSAKNLVLPATTLVNLCYASMFSGCTSLTTAPELPATTLASNCYYSMFKCCTSLTTAPILPATTLVDGCYNEMFSGCTSLTTAPELPATTLAVSCCTSMFYDCRSLTTAPTVLPATTLVNGCYKGMFYNCRQLQTAPELPATTLASNCYNEMFSNCKSLTTAPILPATTLVNGCYNYMFLGCTNLNYIKAMFTTTPGSTYTNNWLIGVASSGTFVKNSAATWDVSGNNGIPSGWTVQTA